ncbi:hypothetical protein SSS_03726 [Sarcoptes scabiei]|uniref:Elongator complex protein 6 n=1 Tax=Sarcoptes scabiei TaxID=52283 RepID=A0A834VE55_SARSC|nr:hypothetical protein SSS_03726 [Sarcoptes scabiei]UXI18926.1 peptidyl-prolyl cis-trans isomerase H [Sarcoptes scabiei]
MFKNLPYLSLHEHRLILSTVRDPLVQSFIYELIIQRCIKERYSILMVLLNQNLHHYKSVLSKRGVNLNTFIDQGLVQIIDTIDISNLDCFDPDCFIEEFQNKLMKLSNENKKIILIDDIAIFDILGLSMKKTYLILNEIDRLISGRKCSLFLGASIVRDVKWNELIQIYLHKCDLWLDIDRPKTGYSQQINGLVECHSRRTDLPLSSKLNFRINNRNITFNEMSTGKSYLELI